MNDMSIATDETDRLIASNKVEGTAVYNRDGERIGTIYNFMVDKLSGEVEYAVLQFGGLLGLGSDYYPLPWQLLRYDTERGGYIVELAKEVLEGAPRYRDEEPSFDARYGEQIHSHYGLAYPLI